MLRCGVYLVEVTKLIFILLQNKNDIVVLNIDHLNKLFIYNNTDNIKC